MDRIARERGERSRKRTPGKAIMIFLVLAGLGLVGGLGYGSLRADEEQTVEEQIPPAPDRPLDEIDEEKLEFEGSHFHIKRLFKRVGWLEDDEDDSAGPTFADWSGKEASWNKPLGGATAYDTMVGRIIDGSSDVLLTSRLDWERQAPEEAEEKLEYAPVAKQYSEYDGEVVGAVEFGLLYLADESERSPLVGAFFEYLQEEGWDLIGSDDVYNFVPPQETFPEFEPPEYFEKPAWERDEYPPMWYGTVRPGGRRYFSTQLATIKRARMAGFNGVSAVLGTEPILDFLEENGMFRNGALPEEPVRYGYTGEHNPPNGASPASVERANQHPLAA